MATQAPTNRSGPGVPTAAQVLLNAPNLVGWLRVALLAGAIACAPTRPVVAWWLAAASLALDGLDGLLARRFGQVSETARGGAR
jgi:phosphatidylglycerophosphate synthase